MVSILVTVGSWCDLVDAFKYFQELVQNTVFFGVILKNMFFFLLWVNLQKRREQKLMRKAARRHRKVSSAQQELRTVG